MIGHVNGKKSSVAQRCVARNKPQYYYTSSSHWQIQDACELKAAAILQADVIHQGGITEFKYSADIVNQNNLLLGTHLFHELSSSLAELN